jgi:hypothetical protein
VPADEIIALLRPGEAVVHLLAAEEATFVFLISAQGVIRGHKVDLSTEQLH